MSRITAQSEADSPPTRRGPQKEQPTRYDGLNSNWDTRIRDINGHDNIAGAGINIAQRVMQEAGAGQIFLSEADVGVLRPSERYMKQFRPYQVIAKHGERLSVSQYIAPGTPGLNCDIPSRLVAPGEVPFSATIAHFYCQALKHQGLLLRIPAILIAQSGRS